MAFKGKLFYIEQQEGDWAGFLVGEGMQLLDGTFMFVRYALEPGYRAVQVKSRISYQELLYNLIAGERVIWYAAEADPIQDMVRRQLKGLKKK
jgi:hypothetical protein